ncbi:hypothetical protein BBJ28_00016959 [Nothophytophthora sp. Chile5]|nr:hypothetical protein BBJ28_00016959 [Nothophytophthora sp. Chile5]
MDVEWHDSWDAFHEYLAEYQDTSHQVFRLRTSTSAARRNDEIRARDSDSSVTLIPPEFKVFWVKFCAANIKAAVTWNDAEGDKKFMVRVTDFDVEHNHRVAKAVYVNHPAVRRVEDPVLLAFVDALQAAGSKPKRIMHKNVTLRDGHNMITKMRKTRRGSASVEERLESVLRGFCERQGNRASVFVDDKKMVQTITLQTRQMRRWFKAFPEVLLVDATHNTYDSRYKLFSFMVHDHNLTENESAVFLTDAMSSFKLETSWGHLKEILKREMPLDECVDTLIFLQAVAEMEYSKKMTDVGQVRYEGADEEQEKLARKVSSHAYRLVEKQYWIANNRKTYYEIDEINSHMFALSRGTEEKYTPDNDVACKTFLVRDSMMAANIHQVFNGSTKFSTARLRATHIADIMSRNGTAVFKNMLAVLEKFEKIIKEGVAPFVRRDGEGIAEWLDPMSQLSSILPDTELSCPISPTDT